MALDSSFRWNDVAMKVFRDSHGGGREGVLADRPWRGLLVSVIAINLRSAVFPCA
jgi:hypothetical protein